MTMIMLTNEEKKDIKRRYLEAQETIIDRLLDGDVSAAADMANVIAEIIPAEVFYSMMENMTDDDCDKVAEAENKMKEKIIEEDRKNNDE